MRYDRVGVSFVKRLVRRVSLPWVYKGNYIVGVSNASYDDLKSRFSGAKCYCIPNAITLDRFSTNERKVRPSNIALIFGTDFLRKGVDVAIKAIQASSNNIELQIVTSNDENAKEMIKKTCNDVPDFVRFVAPIEDVEQLYDRAFVFLSPSRSEAFGCAVSEAGYCGCQVIASDIPGQNMQKNIRGIQWISSEDISGLTTAIDVAYVRWNHNYSELQAQLMQQHDDVRKYYSIEAWCDNVMKVYHDAK